MSGSYFFESVQPLENTGLVPFRDHQPARIQDQQRVWLRTTGYWNYPMGTVGKTPGGLWINSATGKAYSTREKAADALHEWFEREGFASTTGGPQE